MEILKIIPLPTIVAGTLFLLVLYVIKPMTKAFLEKKTGNGNGSEIMRGLVNALAEQGRNSAALLEVNREALGEMKEMRQNSERLLNIVITNQATILEKQNSLSSLITH